MKLQAIHLVVTSPVFSFIFPSWIAAMIFLTFLMGSLFTGCLCDGPSTAINCEVECLIDCPSGSYYAVGNCLECPAGHYCLGGTAAPRKCPSGTANHLPAKDSLKDCQGCDDGYISKETRTGCRPCPSGYSCKPVTGLIERCHPGFWSPEGVLNCLHCNEGYICPDGREKKTCPPGWEPDPFHVQCIQCPVGYFSSEGVTTCQKCPAGSYCPHVGTFRPILCPQGYYTNTAGQSECTKCNGSIFCMEKTHGQIARDGRKQSRIPGFKGSLLPCPSGMYLGLQINEECMHCPTGFYCSDGISTYPCPAGTYGARQGLTKASDCSPCPQGYYCLEGTSGRPGSEFLCPKGFYCPEKTSEPHSNPCPAGTYNDQLGLAIQGGCRKCSDGLICSEGSSFSGLPCSRGRFCPAGTEEELLCPPGTFTQHIGSSRVEHCIKCLQGYYCPQGVTDPVPCQPGWYNPLEGQDNITDCRPCPAGMACTQPGLSHPDTHCLEGYTCPPGSASAHNPDNVCPPGTFTNFNNLSDPSQCEPCPARHVCSKGTGGKWKPPLPCAVGHYCPAGTPYPHQFKCPAGSWSNQTNLASAEECLPCPEGWYCVSGASIPSGRCSSGHYCPAGSQIGSQFPCPAGYYTTHLGNKRVEDCLLCPEGAYCPPGTAKTPFCPEGTYRMEKGGKSLEDCQLCPSGYFCPRSATANPKACGTGSFSVPGSVSCQPCLEGYYCSDEATSETVMLANMACPPGLICSGGLKNLPNHSSGACPIGYYCLRGDIDPKPRLCPNGTYNDHLGLGSLSQCTPCPSGKYCFSNGTEPQPLVEPTGNCPDGYYCPEGTGLPFSYPCGLGNYRNSLKSERGDVCYPCPPGYYCDTLGMVSPKWCPAGFYCVEGASSPQPCEQGTYSNWGGLKSKKDCIPCSSGMYCSSTGLTEPSGFCEAGFYCSERASSATPLDGLGSGICPEGSFCPDGSAIPSPCPPGTYSNITGLKRVEQCADCPPGAFCTGFGNKVPTGLCEAGYFCTGRADTPAQHETMEGHYSSKGAFQALPCPRGTFQPIRAQSYCQECPSGSFCNETGLMRPFICPAGHYCPLGGTLPMPCPVGSYLSALGSSGLDSCQLCEMGMFCSRVGATVPEGPCLPGHYCSQGSHIPNPVGHGDFIVRDISVGSQTQFFGKTPYIKIFLISFYLTFNRLLHLLLN
ncbi:neurogenic locus notch homolog protein 1-like [Protopterus annectens]|uniref:neurogenic locus notch homolog protein 1-like n=1 Tax=Protopterus annectens TaxID=7888 RepID=UPI001CFA27B7|nr:neurogenic locus notch homolog protein 1-like [Protopterus annectens]